MPSHTTLDELRAENEALRAQYKNVALELAEIGPLLKRFGAVVLVPRLATLIALCCLAGLLSAQLPVMTLSIGWIAAFGLMLPIGRLIGRSENSDPNINAAGTAVALLFFVLLLLSRRPGFAALATFLMLRGLIGLSELKHKYMHTYLHAYDALYYLRDLPALRFLVKNLPSLVSAQLLRLSAGILVLVLVCIIEPTAIDWRLALLGVLIGLAALAIARPHIERNHANHFWRPSHIAHFVESVVEAVTAWRRGGVLATQSPEADMPAISATAAREQEKPPPNIILILNESTFPPRLYPSIDYDTALDDFFRSADGRTRELRVEVYGGASWVTEFSALTGIPANSYGTLRPYVYQWATGNIRHSLPLCLKACGFQNVVIYPAQKEFLRVDRFLSSIGFDEIIDKEAMGTTRDREADSFYFSRSLDWLKNHFAISNRPSFTYIFTSSNHDPHALRLDYASGAMVAIENDPEAELHEYLRRLKRSTQDYADFRTELGTRFPGREFLIVHLGDHQPPFTWQMFGHRHSWAGDLKRYPIEERAYRTYCAIDGVNFQPRSTEQIPDLFEVAYLGTAVLMAAGLPLDAVHGIRRELMHRHAGLLFFADADGAKARQLNHRLIEAGFINPH